GGDFLRISHKRIVFSTFINKNFLGGVLAINLPFFLLSLFRAEGIFKKIIYFLGTCVVIYALILTGSKGGILVGIMGILFFISFSFLKQIKEKKMRKRLIILGTIFFVPMGIKVFPWFYSRNCPMSLKERFPFWRLSLRMIGAHPFRGVGIGNFVLFAPGYKPSLFSPEQFIRHAWNEFLEIWAELGFLGFLSFIILLILVSIYALKIIFQQNKESFISIVSLGGLASLFSGILLNLGEINLRIVYLGIYFWISLAILIKIKEIDLDKRVTFFNFPSFFKKISFLFFIFADLCLLKFIFTPLLMYKIAQKKASYGYKITDLDRLENLESELKDSPSLYNNLGNLYLLNGDMEKAKEYYQRALELNPSFSSTNYNLGYIYFLEGKIREAYEKFSFCLKLNPRDADSYFMLKKNILY
ncbi:MAG: tetratricopeptide repeat protein, partial [Candidatus Omnitrophica bacterium]|nr:tetratricopeptide repeat protein [Candidatus Omnitrophota bacterium]